jgi:hypothetical protein
MVSQARIGVADCDRKRDHCAEPTKLIRLIALVSGEYGESFSALNQLLLPLRRELNRLDGLHRNALNVALGFSDGLARDQLVVSNAVLALLCHVAADCPLLLIVDNLQWADRASALVLGSVARRLPGSQVGLLAAERSGSSRFSIPTCLGMGCRRSTKTRRCGSWAPASPTWSPASGSGLWPRPGGTRSPYWNCRPRWVTCSALVSPRCRRSCR